MRLPNTAFTDRPWKVHEFTEDFEVEDVWALQTRGGPDGLALLVEQLTSRWRTCGRCRPGAGPTA